MGSDYRIVTLETHCFLETKVWSWAAEKADRFGEERLNIQNEKWDHCKAKLWLPVGRRYGAGWCSYFGKLLQRMPSNCRIIFTRFTSRSCLTAYWLFGQSHGSNVMLLVMSMAITHQASLGLHRKNQYGGKNCWLCCHRGSEVKCQKGQMEWPYVKHAELQRRPARSHLRQVTMS